MRPSGVITLLTDFGLDDVYVGVMKGVILSRFPQARVVDLTHTVPPQDVARGAFLLAEAAPWFPPGTVHVAVVDPGVGSARRALVAELGDQWVVAPDNGLIAEVPLPLRGAWSLRHPALALTPMSATFHGRDLFAPAGATLASGALRPRDCGPAIDPVGLVGPPGPGEGVVRAVDRFGNLITSWTAADVAAPVQVLVAGVPVERWVRTYADADPGTLVALIGSSGRLEISVVQGSAHARLGAGVGAPVSVSRGGGDHA